MGGPARDRTADFEAVCLSLRSKNKAPIRKNYVNAVPLRSSSNAGGAIATKREQAQPLLGHQQPPQDASTPAVHNKTDFTRRAALISRNIQATAGKLERLTTCTFSLLPAQALETTDIEVAIYSGEKEITL